MGSQPTKKFSPSSNGECNKSTSCVQVAAVSSSPCEFDSAYESLYSAFTSSSNTISSSNTSSPTSTRTCDTYSLGKLNNSVPLMQPLTLNTVQDLPGQVTGNLRNLSSIRLEPLHGKRSGDNLFIYCNDDKGNKCHNTNGNSNESPRRVRSNRLTSHRRSYPMSISTNDTKVTIDTLPPVNDIDHAPPSTCKTLPFKEYKKWLINFRSKSQENQSKVREMSVEKMNDANKLFTPKVRCETATLRTRRQSDPLASQSNNKNNKDNGTGERIFTISDKSYLNSGKSDTTLEPIQCKSAKEKSKSQKQSRKLSIATMNSYNSDLINGASSTVFDLNALNDALTKPRNKVAPASVSLLSVNHLKSPANIF